MDRRAIAALAVVAAALPASALALEYRSVGEAAVLYDAPSLKAKALYVVRRGTPVEVVVNAAGWQKVRDASGELAWIENRWLAEKRTVIVTAERAEVRREPSATSPLVFEAEKDVVLDLQSGAPAGWAKVRHRDGQSGFVRIGQVWGL